MRVVRFDRFGGPDVLELVDEPDPVPGHGEVRIAITAAGVNPADVSNVAGSYGSRPALPATPGWECAGVVDCVGPGVDSTVVGDRVMLPLGGVGRQGAWRDRAIVRANRLFPTPGNLTDAQAGGCWIVFLTAWVGMIELLDLKQGDWLVVTAAGSSVANAVSQIAALRGIRLIGTVRRPDAKPDIAGFEAVITVPGEDLATRVREITGNGARSAFDAVGGPLTSACLDALGNGGEVIVYGRLSDEPITIKAADILFGEKRVRGFWLNNWLRTAGQEKLSAAYSTLLGLYASGDLRPHVDRTFPLESVRDAVRWMAQPGHHGKVVLTSPAPASAK